MAIQLPRTSSPPDDTARKLECALALIRANAEHRIEHEDWGEVTVRFHWQAGRLKEFRFVPETIVRELGDG